MHHFLYQKMQTCSEIEKFIQRNAKTDICRSWRFLIRDLFYSPLLSFLIVFGLHRKLHQFCFSQYNEDNQRGRGGYTMSNSLASVHPELIPEWSERNLPLTPDKITFGSNKRVWWKGACGHEWETSVKARSKGEKCPICSGARVIDGINDLATLKPLLAQEWSEKNKLKPTEISVASHKKIIWKCKHGHEWEASVKSRTINGTGCPFSIFIKAKNVKLRKNQFRYSQFYLPQYLEKHCHVLPGAWSGQTPL